MLPTYRRLTDEANNSTRQAELYDSLANHIRALLDNAGTIVEREVLRAELDRYEELSAELWEDAIDRQQFAARLAKG